MKINITKSRVPGCMYRCFATVAHFATVANFTTPVARSYQHIGKL